MPSGIINSIIASWSVFHYQLQKITSNKRHGMSKNIVITPVYCLVTVLGWLLVAPAAFSQNPTTRQQDFVYKSVKGHDIRATIYFPELQGEYPVVIYFHEGSFL